MKKIIFLLSVLFLSTSIISASVKVVSFVGRVKVKYPGATAWSSLKVGDILPSKAVVSTGFNSKIVLDLGSATLDVLPLTRMTVSEITESNDVISTSLFLQGGKIKADVSKVEGKIHDFKIKSPVATASVRGTSFIFTGNTLFVERGVVDFGAIQAYLPDEAGKEDTEVADEDIAAAETVRIVTVRAGGLTEMVSVKDKPVRPSVMIDKQYKVTVSTKPHVVKARLKEVLGGDLMPSDVPTASDIEDEVADMAFITFEPPVVPE